eukprot:scaffold20651_cov39-Prasinocladus_malaysianus.AAC.1
MPARPAGKEHACDQGGRVIETRPILTSTTYTRTFKTPGGMTWLSYADMTSVVQATDSACGSECQGLDAHKLSMG